MPKFRTLLLVAAAACLIAAVSAPIASAATPPTLQSVNKKANRAITNAASARRRANLAQRNAAKVGADLAAAVKRLGTAEGGLAGVLAAAPQIVDNLTKLGAAVQNEIAPGLKTLADVVQNQIGPGLKQLSDAVTGQIAPGLTKLGDAYGAVEYGRAALFVGGTSTPVLPAGGSVTSADIPDDGNAISVGDDGVVVAGTGTGLPGDTLTIDLRAAIRSAEADGDSAAKTAGQAGGFLMVRNADTGARVACTGAPNPPGIFGTQAGDSIVTPTGTVTNLPLKNIPGGVLRTDTSKPDATSTNLLPATCTITGVNAGTTYNVHYSVQFVDIPTSATPGPKD